MKMDQQECLAKCMPYKCWTYNYKYEKIIMDKYISHIDFKDDCKYGHSMYLGYGGGDNYDWWDCYFCRTKNPKKLPKTLADIMTQIHNKDQIISLFKIHKFNTIHFHTDACYGAVPVVGYSYIYYDDDNLTSTTTFSNDIITQFTWVGLVYWDATNNTAIMLSDERHGYLMDSSTHIYHHLTTGAQYQDGLGLGNMDIDGNGNDNSAAQFSFADGAIWDEDIQHLIVDGSPQELSTIAEIPMYYRLGAAGDWRKVAATTYPITTTGSGRAAWNEFTGGAWQLTEVASVDYVLVHYYATNDQVDPIIGIVGQADYSTVNLARLGALVEIRTLQFGPLDALLPETVPIATVIFETRSTYSNAVKSRVRSTDTGDDYIDWRPSFVPNAGTSL